MGKKAVEAFQRKAEDEDDEETFLEWLMGKFNEKFVNNIPSDSIRDLPPRYIMPVGTFAYMASSLCFLYFILQGYTTARKQQFISLDEDDGECSVVLTTVDGTFYGSTNGLWGGESGFKYTHALYRVDLLHYKNSEEEYTRQMNDLVRPALQQLSALSVNSDATFNMLMWMSWEARLQPDIQGDHNVFQMSGNPLIIFNRKYFFGIYSGLKGDCLLEGDSQYNGGDGMMSLQYSHEEFIADPICSSTAEPEYMGFNQNYDFDFFRTKVDVSSLITCMAVNMGILHFEELDVIEGSLRNSTLPNSTEIVYISQRFDFRYPGMDPVLCIETELLSNAVCFLLLGDTLSIPIMNHYGKAGEPCNCSIPGHGDEDSNCQVFDFMVGALFYKAPTYFFGDDYFGHPVNAPVSFNNASDIGVIRLLREYSIQEINQRAYTISYAALEQGKMVDPAFREESYAFCTLEGVGACSVLIFNPYGQEINSVSEFYYQVPYPACHDTFTVSDEAWNNLAGHAPVDLVQEYFACKATVYDALFNSVGIASGNTATFVPILMLFLLPLIYIYLSSSGNLPPKKEYEEEDLEKATKAFATALLRVRDGKVRGMKKGGALTTVATELIATASEVAAYPDSDDDESDDEDGEGHRAKRSFSVSNRKLQGQVFMRKEHMDVEDSDDDEEGPASSKQEQASTSGGGFFDSIFSQNPLQQQEQRDMELGNMSSDRTSKKKKKKRVTKTSTKITILNEVEYMSSSKVVELREVQNCVTALMEALERAKKVVGLDGADNVFNQAVKASLDLHNIDLALLPSIDFPAWFDDLRKVVILHASLAMNVSQDQVASTDAAKFAYRVGDRIYTIKDLKQLSYSKVDSKLILSLGFPHEGK